MLKGRLLSKKSVPGWKRQFYNCISSLLCILLCYMLVQEETGQACWIAARQNCQRKRDQIENEIERGKRNKKYQDDLSEQWLKKVKLEEKIAILFCVTFWGFKIVFCFLFGFFLSSCDREKSKYGDVLQKWKWDKIFVFWLRVEHWEIWVHSEGREDYVSKVEALAVSRSYSYSGWDQLSFVWHSINSLIHQLITG